MPATARGQRTRQLILDSTVHVFGQQGYAGATLNRLVESTGLTRGAFYFHFESKDALAVAIAEEQLVRWQQLRDEVETQEHEPLRRLVTLICRAGLAFRYDPTIRAATRLLLDSGLIQRELPRTAPWWQETVIEMLDQAEAEGCMFDLSFLFLTSPEAAGVRGTERLADYLVTTMANIGHATAARPEAQFELLYVMWAVVLPSICNKADTANEHLALVRELLLAATAQVVSEQSG